MQSQSPHHLPHLCLWSISRAKPPGLILRGRQLLLLFLPLLGLVPDLAGHFQKQAQVCSRQTVLLCPRCG